ncbi:MAG: ABC transporter ATP-binding protein [bacterium]|nr:ABC transporter ATP-binding protein [bacterium]
MKENLLIINELHAGYNGQGVLQDVSLNVGEGEIICLIGPNGAGKSTVLRAIFSQADKTSGTIIFSGRDITRVGTSDLLALGIAYVPQGRPVFSNMTVEENLLLGGHLLRDTQKLRGRLEKLYALFPVLLEKRHDKTRNLSGGQQQLCAIARGLVMEPKLLLLDEPSLGLAPKVCQEVFAHLKKLNEQDGVSLLIVEQNVHLVLGVAHRGYLMAAGRVAAEGAPNVLREQLDAVYLGNGSR